jgi:nucleoside-diphosphate-sugar epimerase
MKIAVTGANGFVGSNLANYFHSQGWDVTAIVRPHADISALDPGIDVRRTDYETGLEEALAGTEILLHNAGSIRTLTFAEMVSANVATTRRLVDAFNRIPTAKRFIYISSQAASHPSKGNECVNEDEASAPVDWYGRSKALSERIIKTQCSREWTIVRPASVYGPGEKDFLQIFKKIKSGISFQIGSQDQYLSLIHIRELCEFLSLCCTEANAARQVFFASDGETYTHRQFMDLAANLLGVKTVHLTIPTPLAVVAFHAGDLLERVTHRISLINKQKMKELINVNWVCSIAKARNLLGWEPHADLEGNLAATFAWYKDRGWL